MKAYCTIKSGKLELLNRKRFEQDLKEMKDGQYELNLRLKNRKTVPQNNYYHGVVIPEIRIRLTELGHRLSDENVHDLLKTRFLAFQIVNEQGEVAEYPGSTAGLNKAEFSEYLDNVIQWAAEFLSIEIPAPNENLRLAI